MPTPSEKIAVLNRTIKELQRRYDHINNSYDQLRNKVLAAIGGEITGVSLIFAKGTFLPREQYGRVFYFIGISLVVIAFSLLLSVISSVDWLLPIEIKEVQKFKKENPSEIKFLEYVRDEYIECVVHCLSKYEKRMKRFDWAVYLLVAGVIMLLVIRLGGK